MSVTIIENQMDTGIHLIENIIDISKELKMLSDKKYELKVIYNKQLIKHLMITKDRPKDYDDELKALKNMSSRTMGEIYLIINKRTHLKQQLNVMLQSLEKISK